jgi:lipoprotein NlpD
MPMKMSGPTRSTNRGRARNWLAACALLLLAGCAARHQAVVEDRSPPASTSAKPPVVAQQAPVPGVPAVPEAPTYTVKKGDTLYFIALDHGQDYRDVAAWNNLDHPDRISVGQVLRLGPPKAATAGAAAAPVGSAQVGVVVPQQQVEARPLGGANPAAQPTSGVAGAAKNLPKTGKEAYTEQAAGASANAAAGHGSDTQIAKNEPRPEGRAADDEDRLDWGWPVHGKMIGGFSESTNKGIDIAAKIGDPVIATASGKVVYSGSALRGYGKLIVIKHNATYFSAYAHNNEILVKEGQLVVKGQKIAEVGNTDADQPMLHFEIRKQGKPVDPLKYLPAAG